MNDPAQHAYRAHAKPPEGPPAPLRLLGVFDASMLVVGSVVGAGIFLVGGYVAQSVKSPAGFLGLWLAGGLFALCGALSNGELGALFPRGGGEYVYLRHAYGPAFGFLSGWTSFWIGFPGSIATLAAGLGRGVGSLVGVEPKHALPFETAVGIVFVVLLTAINAAGLRPGKWVQNILSVGKLIAFGAALVLGVFFGKGHGASFTPWFRSGESASGMALALIPIYFAYSGWNAATYVAGELKNPQKDLGRALAYGTLACLVLYLAVNAGFLNALGLERMRSSTNIAGDVASEIFGGRASRLVTVVVVLAVLSSMQASVLVGPRIYQAMAEDGLFFSGLGVLHPKTRVPVQSLITQGLLSCVLLVSGRFEQLLTFTTVALLLFSILTVAAVPVLRARGPALERTFRTPGYPITPLIYVVGNVWVLWCVVASGAIEAMIGLGIVLTGVPAYFFFRQRRAPA